MGGSSSTWLPRGGHAGATSAGLSSGRPASYAGERRRAWTRDSYHTNERTTGISTVLARLRLGHRSIIDDEARGGALRRGTRACSTEQETERGKVRDDHQLTLNTPGETRRRGGARRRSNRRWIGDSSGGACAHLTRWRRRVLVAVGQATADLAEQAAQQRGSSKLLRL